MRVCLSAKWQGGREVISGVLPRRGGTTLAFEAVPHRICCNTPSRPLRRMFAVVARAVCRCSARHDELASTGSASWDHLGRFAQHCEGEDHGSFSEWMLALIGYLDAVSAPLDALCDAPSTRHASAGGRWSLPRPFCQSVMAFADTKGVWVALVAWVNSGSPSASSARQ